MRKPVTALAFATGLVLPVPCIAGQNVTLADAVKVAAAKSPTLRQARDDFRLTEVNVDLARTPSAPSVSVAASDEQQREALITAPSEGVTASVTQLIYDGGRVVAQIRSARDARAAGSGTYQRALQQLTFNVAQAYYNALQARAAVALAMQVVQQNVTQENLIRAQMRAGTASQVDLATAHLPTIQAQVNLARAQGQDGSAEAAFDNVLGLEADAGIIPAEDPNVTTDKSLIANEPLDYDVATKRAHLLRPDYRAAQHSVDAANETLRAARRGHAPVLNANGSYGAQSGGVGTALQRSDAFGATLFVPVFDQGITNAQVEQADALLDRSRAFLQQSELQVGLDVSQALSNLASSRAALQAAQAELDEAKRVLSQTQTQYRAGVTTLPLLLNAQVGLTQAENDHLSAIYALRQAEQAYVFALGDL